MIAVALSTTHRDGGEYARALDLCGAAAQVLTFDVATIDAQLDGCSGVVLSGGGDVDPQLYGAPSDRVDGVRRSRDSFEIALLQRARERGLPMLCICRGLQLANVALGGTLVPDIGDAFGPTVAARHRQIDSAGGEAFRGIVDGHDVRIAPDSELRAIVGAERLTTSSRHHQGLATVATELRTVATTVDGVIEAAEARFASPFWLGVQWHPESTFDRDAGASRAIFGAFVAAANEYSRNG